MIFFQFKIKRDNSYYYLINEELFKSVIQKSILVT